MTLDKNEKGMVNQGPTRAPSSVSGKYDKMDALEKLAPILADQVQQRNVGETVVLSSQEYCTDYAASLLRSELSRRNVRGIDVATNGDGRIYNIDALVESHHLLG